MTFNKDNIILIGMPGAGKSTIGIVLAKVIGYTFIDSDIVIQNEKKMLLHELIEKYGLDGFNSIENEINAKIDTHKSIIATGGSAIYGKEAMSHLKSIGTVIYLKLPYEEIEERLGDLNKRGVSIKEGQTLKSLYEERIILYEKYKNTDDIKVGNIIVFYEDDIKVIHRIIDQKLMGEETRYYTKGDANQKQDEGYRETKDIIGQVKARIPYMGWFTLWINDWRK